MINQRYPNGRIGCSPALGHGMTVSLSSPDFYAEIESPVKPLVWLAIKKKLTPITSCSGHSKPIRGYMSLAFNSLDESERFYRAFCRSSFCRVSVCRVKKGSEFESLLKSYKQVVSLSIHAKNRVGFYAKMVRVMWRMLFLT